MVRRRKKSWRLGTRLLLLALVPALWSSALTFSSARASWEAVEQSELVEDHVDRLSTLMGLRFAHSREQLILEGVFRAEEAGISSKLLAAFLDIDVAVEGPQTRAEVDRLLGSLEPGDPAAAGFADLDALRQAFDSRSITPDDLRERLNAMRRPLEVALKSELIEFTALAPALPISTELETTTQELAALSSALTAAIGQIGSYFQAVSTGSFDDRMALANDMWVYESAAATLAVSGGPGAARFAEFETTEQHLTFGAEMDRLLEADEIAPKDLVSEPAQSAGLFRAAVQRSELLNTVVTETTADLRANVADARSKAGRRATLALISAAGLFVMGAAIAVNTARAVVLPLRRLELLADRVSRGEVPEPLAPAGPREVIAAAEAINEMVASLSALERQASALAEGDLDDPVLVQSLPGTMGTSLRASVTRLSTSMAKQEELRRRLAHEATHDLLTGLPNRSAMVVAAAEALNRAGSTHQTTAMLYIDLDGFKSANDLHGHDVGDQVLRIAASRLRGAIRPGDVAARLGGDEFLVVAEGVSAQEAVDLGERIVASLAEPMRVGDRLVLVGASIGVAVATESQAIDDVLRDADRAVYRAKEEGKGRVALFDHDMKRRLSEERTTERALLEAIPKRQLHAVYQPIVGPDGVPWGAEALIRWERPGHGLVSPASFIPLAEVTGQITDLGRWMLTEVTSLLARWSTQPGNDQLCVSLNLSGQEALRGDLAHHVLTTLRRGGANPSKLTLEVSENALLFDLPAVAEQLSILREAGVRIAIDDFGTGYTSVSHLRSLPVDTLKIDRSLLQQASKGEADLAIFSLVIAVARTLQLATVAEGVETAAHQALVESVGCDLSQGYLFGRPMGLDDLERWLLSRTIEGLTTADGTGLRTQ